MFSVSATNVCSPYSHCVHLTLVLLISPSSNQIFPSSHSQIQSLGPATGCETYISLQTVLQSNNKMCYFILQRPLEALVYVSWDADDLLFFPELFCLISASSFPAWFCFCIPWDCCTFLNMHHVWICSLSLLIGMNWAFAAHLLTITTLQFVFLSLACIVCFGRAGLTLCWSAHDDVNVSEVCPL